MSGHRGTSRRAVTLIEATIVVVVLALAVPPMLSVTTEVVDAQAESVQISCATSLAQGIVEHVLADVHSGEGAPGLAALADADVYLEHPSTGLRTRLAWLAEPYEARGMSWDVEIGPLVNATGSESGDGAADIYRHVDVEVTFGGSRGQMSVSLGLVVGGTPP